MNITNTMKNIYVFALLMFLGTTVSAQFSLPSMEASLKGGYSIVAGSDNDFEGINISGSLLVHINENIAVGPFFSHGADMIYAEYNDNSDGLEKEADQSIIGINARFSTNRNGGLRPYLNFSFFQLEQVADFGDYRLAQKTAGFGLGLGLMIKINRNLYINAIEATARQIGDDVFFLEEGKYVIQLQAGISYNFGKSK